MVCWVKTLGIYALLTAALLATATEINGHGKMMRLDTGIHNPGPTGNLTNGPTGNMTESARNCARLKVAMNETAELWTRPLTREEYYRRNFMWVRCRSMQAKWFDMGGAWFGRDGEALKKYFLRELVDWQFKYVRSNWGDATLFFNQWGEKSLEAVVAKMLRMSRDVSWEFKRNFYIVDCPGFEEYPYYVTERTGVHFPNPDQIRPKNGNRAIYNSEMMALRVGRFQPMGTWPKKNTVYEKLAQ